MQHGTVNRRRIVAEVDAVIDVQFVLLDLLRERGISKEQLAQQLGVSKSRVSQLFSAGANPTVKQLARVFDALDARVMFESLRLEHRNAAVEILTASAKTASRGIRLHPGDFWETANENCAPQLSEKRTVAA